MWRELIEDSLQKSEFKPIVKFNQSAAFSEIVAVEESLGVILPDDLKNLLKETNGVSDDYGCGHVWSTERIQQDNLQFRTFEDFKICICHLIAYCFLQTLEMATNLRSFN